MFRIALILSCLVAAAPAQAADEAAKKQKGNSKLERSIDKATAAAGRTAEKAERGVKKGYDSMEKGINTAGKKTGQWLDEKLK